MIAMLVPRWGFAQTIVVNGTGTNQYVPMYNWYNDYGFRSEYVIPASYFSSAGIPSGASLNSITLYRSATGEWTAGSLTIILTNTSTTSYSNTSFLGLNGTTVYNTNSSYSGGTNSTYTFTFSSPFTYTGGSLVVHIYAGSGGTCTSSSNSSTWYGISSTSNYQACYAYGSSSTNATTGTRLYFLPKTAFTYTIPPSNSTCATATTLSCGSTLNGTTVGTPGTAHGLPSDFSLSNYGVWYTFTGDGRNTTITVSPSSGLDTEIAVVSGSCGGFTYVSGNDSYGDDSCTFPTSSGTTYYVYVADYHPSHGASYTGTFTISRTCSYTVSYNANGGTGTMTDSNSPYASGSTVTVLANAFTAPSGMTFSGWNTAANGSGTSYSPGATFTISANTTLYAQWVSACDYSEDFEGVTGTSGYGTAGSLPTGWNYIWNYSSSPAYAAHVYLNSAGTPGPPSTGNYLGFYASGSTSEYSYAIMPAVAANEAVNHISFTYNFESAGNGTLTYGVIDGTDASTYTVLGTITNPSTNPGTVDAALNVSQTTGKRIAFRWYKTGTWYTCGIDDICVMTTTSYTVTYNANGGTGTMTDPDSPYNSGSTVTVLANSFTAPSGMTFNGWNTASDGSGTSYAAGDHFNISANTILYAQWTVDCDYSEDFESVSGASSGYSSAGSLPTGWDQIYGGTVNSTTAQAPHVHNGASYPGHGTGTNALSGYYLGFYGTGTGSVCYAIMPALAANEAANHISFKYRYESTSDGTLSYGIIDGTDASTFVQIGTCSNSSNNGLVDVALDVSQTESKRIAFCWYYSASSWYTAGIDDICVMTETVSNCPPPTNVTASNLTHSSAHISWDGEADSYNVRYATATITGTTLDPVFEDGFEDGIGSWTTYANGYSNEVTNWRQYDATNFSSGGVTNHTGNYVAMSRSYDGSLDRSVDNWLVSPQMTLGDVVKFWVCGDDAGWQEYYEVYVSTGTNAVSDFELVEAPALAPSDGTWAERTVDLSAYAGQQGYVAIRHTDTGKDYLLIDDFGVYNTVNSYSYGTWQTVTPSPTTTSCDINGLSAETLYAVQVQADCGSPDGTSGWSSVYFTTPDACSAPTDLVSSNITAATATLGWSDNQDSYNVRYRKVYFYEGFEGSTLPTGWTTIDANSDGNTWSVGHATAHSGHNGVYNLSYIYNTSGTSPDDYLVSPQLDLQGTLRVWLSGYERQSSNYSEHFEILLSTTGTSVSDFTTTLVGETTTTNGYVEYTADLSSYTGQGYIAIHHFNCSDQYYLYVDDFGLYGTDNWVSVSPSPTDATTTLTGLTPMTDYEWQVQGVNCDGNGHTTDWSATANFTTSNGYIITATADPSGSGTFAFTGSGVVSSNATSAVVTPNGDVTVTATATAGYTFMNWIEGGSVVSTTNAYALTGVNASHDLIAHFVDMTASNTWPAAVTTLAAATPGYSVDGSTITISNANGLAWLISTVNGLNSQSGNDITSSTVINLTADVDMSAHIWVPIGTTEHPFVGTFNGNGHTISGVTRALEFPNQGVFGYVSGGTIHDVVVNTNITGDCNYMGSVAGTLASGTVYNTGSAGTVTANANTIAVGGTVGYNGGLVHSSFATGTFTGLAGDYVGGLVGENAPAGRLYNSYSNATLTGGNRGGLVGYNKGTAANCYNVNNSATYAYANINAGTMEYVYSDNTNNSYYNTIEGSPTLQYHGSSFSSVQSDIKHLDYMYRDNAITLAGGQTNSYVPSSVSYDNNHTVKWNGLVSALNQWVADNKTSGVAIGTLSSWYRPLTTAINGDLPVLGFGGETTLGAAAGSPKTLKYGTMDDLLTIYNGSTASIFHYGKATGVTHVPTANVNVFINEDAVLLQATSPDPGAFINTTVGVTFDNSDHGTHAYDYWGNKLDYDWHFLSTPLSDAKIGATYNDYVAHGYGSDIDIKALVNSYFPNNLPMTLHDANWRWDFYTYYEPEYHWINMKRNKNNHYHVDGGWSISYTYNADDQAVGDAASLACVFTPGKGYMMAISKDVFMNSTGTLNRGNVPIRLTLKEPDDINYASGWNLVGNPYQAYLNINALNRNLYIYDADQGVYAPYAPAASGNPATPSQYIHPHQAFFVHAASDGEELIFTPTMASTETTPYSYYRDDRIDYPLVNLYAENNAGQRDLTVVEFHRPELGGARKLETMRNAPFTLAAHYAGISYGILFATDDIERIPVRFKTDENGWVTLTWSTHNGEFSKLLLIDNKLGVERNMLADNSYTFEASPDDYSSRFYIVYDCSGMGVEENDESGASTGSATAATFAYINNGNIVVDIGSGYVTSIQVIDVLGRVLYSKTIAGIDGTYTVSTKGLAKGVYLIRLADGHNVKTQKLVVQ